MGGLDRCTLCDDAIFGAFVTQDGTVSHSSTGLPLIVGESDQWSPSLCWDGARYLLGWYDYRDPSAVRASVMDTDGHFADTNGILVSTNEQYTPYVFARADGSFLSVHGYDSVFIETIAAQGSALTVGTQRMVSVAGAYERYNSGACDGTNYWVAFEYHRRNPIAWAILPFSVLQPMEHGPSPRLYWYAQMPRSRRSFPGSWSGEGLCGVGR